MSKKGRGLINKVVFNTEKAPFDNHEFRKAMAYGINRQEIIDIAQRGNGVIGETGIIPIDSKYYNPKLPKYTYSLEKSRTIMNSLGYEIEEGYYSKDGKILEIELMGYEDIKRDIDVLVKQLNTAGFKIKVKMYDLASCDENLIKKNYDITITEDAVIGDPIYINNMIFAETGSKFKKKNIALMKNIALQLSTSTEEERKNLLSEIQAEYSELLPGYVLYYGKFNVAYNDKIDVYFTKDGYSTSMNLPFNKLMFLE
ncbi:MAG: ABC transporter substrate-binding protein [Firmicutes bacterium]|jgi:peptide/nickel transport system substrate-binding protein|nr:ABC transporter substrate-binding protein [Bacillota bacterium]